MILSILLKFFEGQIKSSISPFQLLACDPLCFFGIIYIFIIRILPRFINDYVKMMRINL